MVEATSGGLVESLVQLLTEFGRVAIGVDPLTTVLLLFGAALTGVSVLVFGYLAAGAVLDGLADLIPSPSNPGPGGPPRDRE
jgi:hypothetical protein